MVSQELLQIASSCSLQRSHFVLHFGLKPSLPTYSFSPTKKTQPSRKPPFLPSFLPSFLTSASKLQQSPFMYSRHHACVVNPPQPKHPHSPPPSLHGHVLGHRQANICKSLVAGVHTYVHGTFHPRFFHCSGACSLECRSHAK